MKRFISKKTVAIGVTAGLLLGVSGAAFAYFTSTGTGSGTASVGSAANNITVVATEAPALTPGGTPGTVSFSATNGAAFNQQISSIHLVSITADGGHTLCNTSDFSMADVTVGTDGNLGPNATVALTETGTLTMADNGNQNACQGATLTLAFTTA